MVAGLGGKRGKGPVKFLKLLTSLRTLGCYPYPKQADSCSLSTFLFSVLVQLFARLRFFVLVCLICFAFVLSNPPSCAGYCDVAVFLDLYGSVVLVYEIFLSCLWFATFLMSPFRFLQTNLWSLVVVGNGLMKLIQYCCIFSMKKRARSIECLQQVNSIFQSQFREGMLWLITILPLPSCIQERLSSRYYGRWILTKKNGKK